MQKAGKNFIYNLIYQLFILIVPLITSPYISRIFGPDGVGTYSYYFSIATYFTYFELLGINNYGVRAIAKCQNQNERDEAFSNIYASQLMVSLFVFSVYLLFSLIIPGVQHSVALCFIPYVLSSLFDINWYFFGTEQFASTTIRNCTVKTAVLILIFVVIKTQDDLNKYILLISMSYLLSQLIMWFILLRQIKLRRPNLRQSISHIKVLLILFIPVLAVSLYRLMDKVMLGLMSNMTQVGYYENAEKIVGVPGAVTTALGTAMLPRITNLLSQKNDGAVVKNISSSLYFVEALSFAMLFGLIAVSDVFIPIYYGSAFTESAAILKILSLSLIFSSCASVVRTQYLIPTEKDKIYIWSVISGAVMNIIFNLIFIPFLGAEGAALGTIIAEATVFFYQTMMVKKDIPVFRMVLRGWPYLINGIIMLLLITVFNHFVVMNQIPLLLCDIGIGIVIYALLSIPVALKYFRKLKSFSK